VIAITSVFIATRKEIGMISKGQSRLAWKRDDVVLDDVREATSKCNYADPEITQAPSLTRLSCLRFAFLNIIQLDILNSIHSEEYARKKSAVFL